MTRLNRNLEYSLMALKVMLEHEPLLRSDSNNTDKGQFRMPASAKEIADKTHTPYEVTARVLQRLAHKKILRAEMGTHGGYVLEKDLNEITLMDLFRAVQGTPHITRCLNRARSCKIESNCNILEPMHSLNEKLQQFFSDLSVAEILQSPGRAKTVEATHKKKSVSLKKNENHQGLRND